MSDITLEDYLQVTEYLNERDREKAKLNGEN
jgi:hypothetical protein